MKKNYLNPLEKFRWDWESIRVFIIPRIILG
jgi:hypothetical protein